MDDYLIYTKCWLERVNRGGLFLIDDTTHLLFLDLQYATRSIPPHPKWAGMKWRRK